MQFSFSPLQVGQVTNAEEVLHPPPKLLTLQPLQVKRVKSRYCLRDPRWPADASLVDCPHAEHIGVPFKQSGDWVLADFYRSIITLNPVFGTHFTPSFKKRK